MNQLNKRKHLSKLLIKYMSTTNYQYLQNSKIPTLHFQKSLPRLPIPKLEKTCERYLAAQKPILKNEEFINTEIYTKKFESTIGKQLNEQLLEQNKINKNTSYISEPWFDMYLRDRTPLPINYNPVLVFENNIKSEFDNQLIKSTNMLIDSLRFMNSLRKNILDPEVFHLNPKKSNTNTFRTITSLLPAAVSWYGAYMFNAYPLDMSQYKNLFNSTRIPMPDKDRIYQDTTKKHVIVMRKGHFYLFEPIDANGNILPPKEIMGCLDYILKDDVAPAEYPIGILTTENRNVWASARNNLIEAGNETALNLIDSALFTICFDEEHMNKDPYIIMRQYLHGDGKNRWFDKSFSLIFTQDGYGGVNFEHSWGDGVAVLRYFQDIYKSSVESPHVHPNTNPDTNNANEKVQKLKILYNDKVKADVSQALKKYKSICESLGINYMLTDGMGKNLCKKYGVSPDAIMQLGFQSAYHKQTGKFVGSYESCSTAAFKHGRTETIRPCTEAVKAYCEAINSKAKPSNETLYGMIKECSTVHNQLTKEAAMGQGFDRHLFTLKYIAQKQNIELPSIYTDPAYAKLNHHIISTSTLSSPAVQAGGFGPVVKDGYGIGYMIRDKELGTVVTSYPQYSNGADYLDCLQKSYEEIMNIFHNIKN